MGQNVEASSVVLQAHAAATDAMASQLQGVSAFDPAMFQASMLAGLGPIGAPFIAAYMAAATNHVANAQELGMSLRGHAQGVRDADAAYEETDGASSANIQMTEVDDTTTVACHPGTDCPADLKKQMDKMQHELEQKPDKKDFADQSVDDAVKACVTGAVTGGVLTSETGPFSLGGAAAGCVIGGTLAILGDEVDQATSHMDHKH